MNAVSMPLNRAPSRSALAWKTVLLGSPLVVATVVFVAFLGLFLYLSRHVVGPTYPIHYFGF